MTHPDTTTAGATPAPGTRSCAICGTAFPIDPRNPARTYCNHRCRNTAWRRRRATPDAVTPDAARAQRNPVTTPNAATNTAATNGVNTAQHCPHCRQPIVLVTLITTPAAAHVTVPDPPATRRHQLRPL